MTTAKAIITAALLLVTVFSALAVDLVPQGNVNLKGRYNLTNASYVCIGDDCRSSWPTGGGGGGISTIAGLDNYIIVLNGTSANVSANLSAFNVYNDTLFCSALVSSVGNWSADKTSYNTITQANAKYVQNVTCTAGNVLQNATTSGGQCIPMTIDTNDTLRVDALVQENGSLWSNASAQATLIGSLLTENGSLWSNASSQATMIGALFGANTTLSGRVDSLNTSKADKGSVLNTTTQFGNTTGGNVNITGTYNTLVGYVNCVALTGSSELCDGSDAGTGGGMTSWTLSNGSTTDTISDGEQVNITAGRNVTITQVGAQLVINAIDTDTDTDTWNTTAQMQAATNNTLTALRVACGNITGASANLCTITQVTDTNSGGVSNYTAFVSPNGSIVFVTNGSQVNATINGSWLDTQAVLQGEYPSLDTDSTNDLSTSSVLMNTTGSRLNITGTYQAIVATIPADNLTGADIQESTLGTVPTATALAADPANCAAGSSAAGVTAGGVAEGCQDTLNTSDTAGGEASGTFGALVLSNDALDDQYIELGDVFNNASGDVNVTGTYGALVLEANCVAITGSADLCDGNDGGGGAGGLSTISSPNASIVVVQNSSHANLTVNVTYLDGLFVGQTEYANLDTDSTNDLTTSTSFSNASTSRFNLTGVYNALVLTIGLNALTGTDIDESTLGTVPTATSATQLNGQNSDYYLNRTGFAAGNITSGTIAVTYTAAKDTTDDSVTGTVDSSEITDGAIAAVDILDGAINSTKLNITNAGTNGQVLTKAASGQFTWADDATGGAGGNPFNQSLNTSDSVKFANVNVSTNVTVGSYINLMAGGGIIGAGGIPNGTAGCAAGQVLSNVTMDSNGAWTGTCVSSPPSSWTNYTNSDKTVTGTTLANITGLEWGASANTNYTMDCIIFYRSNTTTGGLSLSLEDWGSTVARFRASASIYGVSATTQNSGTFNTTATKVTSTAVTAVNTVYYATLFARIQNNGNAVTITPQFSSEVAGNNATIVRDSYCEVTAG